MEKIWLNSYQEGVPAEINPDAYSSLVDLFEKSCAKYGDKPAFANMGTKLSYIDMEQKTRDFAAYLQQELGLAKGQRIAVMMPNCLQYPIAMFGAMRAGLSVVNVNPLYTADELTHQINDAGVETIVVLANFADTVEKALPRTNLKNIIVTELGDVFPFPKSFIVNAVVRYVKKMVPAYQLPNAIKFRQVMKLGRKLELKSVGVTGSDIAFLQYTGGTTGVAKGAVLTHRNMVANLEQAAAWFKFTLDEGKEIIITALPLYHIFSLTANCLVFFKQGALNVLITNPRDIAGFTKEIKNLKFTAITGVNTLFNALLNHKEFASCDFSQLKLALGGGMAVQEAVATQWKEVTKRPLLEAYGLTETSPAVCINPFNLTEYNGTIGLPISSTEISIRDENGKEVGVGEDGELCVRGPQVMQGYWNRPDETKKVLNSDGWLRTGDVARIDENGFVKLVDRIKDMIVVSGFNVYPNEVEDIIATHDGVLEVGVVGVPSNGSGEKVKAFIVKKDPELTKDAIVRHCKQFLTNYKIPKAIEFREELPKSNVGKILRRELR